jgi:hypothetical protein
MDIVADCMKIITDTRRRMSEYAGKMAFLDFVDHTLTLETAMQDNIHSTKKKNPLGIAHKKKKSRRMNKKKTPKVHSRKEFASIVRMDVEQK